MDSLFWKMGPLRALIHGGPLSQEGMDVSPARSVQVSAQRSSATQLKTSTMTVSTPPTEEASGGSLTFNPLPLPPPNSAVPAPLKFLWFKRNNQQQVGESVAPTLQEHNEAFSFLDNQSKDRRAQMPLVPSPSEHDQEQEGLLDSHTSESKQCRSDNVDRDTSPVSSMTHHTHQTKSWIFKLIDLKALWQDPKTAQRLKIGASTAGEQQSTILPTSSPCNLVESDQVESNSSSCNLSCKNGDCLEVPYERVLHSRESFSKFLQDAPLSNLKVISQMSILCDLAYMIPDIQPGQLLKSHRLKFLTSSLDKKMEAAAKMNEADILKKQSHVDDSINPPAGALSQGLSPAEANSTSLNMGIEHTAEAVLNISSNDFVQVKGSSQWTEESQSKCVESLMAVAPVTAMVVAEEETKQAVAHDLHSSHSCPCEWYICDEESTHTRIFVIQGSESMASWQANLFFEPTKFEGLDVLVHRGIYDAANALYEQVLPEVLAHFKAHGDLAQYRFTGHSLGGSLALLLALIFQIRQTLPPSAILPVITFGSPCIMCGGDYVLKKLNLSPNFIQSVIMHRDVVPRAFACDYPDHVAQVLKRLNGRFRDHPCLNNQKLLYAPMGQLLILQPDETVAPPHPLLPSGRGLYLLRHPINGESIENATQLRAAQRAFLNMPHPLEILSDPGAYGFEGAVSRDHNPRSYTTATHLALQHEVKRLRRIQREQRRQLWWPLVIAESSKFMQKGAQGGLSADKAKSSSAATSALSKSSLVFKQSVNYALTNQIGFASRTLSIWGSHKDAISRYARLIASQHVQMGILFIVSARMVIVECFSTLFVWI